MTLAKLIAREVIQYLTRWYPCRPEYRYEFFGDEGLIGVAVYPVVPDGTDLFSDAAWPQATKSVGYTRHVNLTTDMDELVKGIALDFMGSGGVWS